MVTAQNAKRTVVYSGGSPWKKKSSNDMFDVTMGSYDGAETCELVVCLMLHKLQPLLGKDVGLYRDDGLSVVRKRPRQVEITKKEICKLFAENQLKITADANKRNINFLDANLDLPTGTYKPYMKPGNKPLYVNVKSNHPPCVLKSIPEGINKRLSQISSTEDAFNSAIGPYQEALDKSGYDYKLKYQPTQNTSRKNRKRNITWFNPPYDASVKTNIGRKFISAIDKCFPSGHPLHQICNRNTLKLSYSCMPNVQAVIQTSNRNKLVKTQNINELNKDNMCNCRNKQECPLPGKCQSSNIIYQAKVSTEDSEETYIGLTATTFKKRFSNHKQSFNDRNKRFNTQLSKYVWELKDQEKDFIISWKIITKAMTY